MTQSESLSETVNLENNPTPVSSNIVGRLIQRIGGSKAKELERFLKFAVVGFSGFLVNAIIFNILLKVFNVTRDNQAIANILEAIAYGIAIFNNFVWNRFWVYPDSRSKPFSHQLVTFYVINAMGWLLNAVIIALSNGPLSSFASHLLNHTEVTSGDISLGFNMGLLLATAIVMFWNFFVNRYITYNDVK
jgi:putative flippase GtrA